MKKKTTTVLLIFILILLMMLTLMSGFQFTAHANTQNLEVGDYIQFGTYYNQPILWRVINIDKNGDPMLLSEYILSLKAFDAAGDAHTDPDRKQYGSTYWPKATIRQWLNSHEESIQWIQNPPTEENMWNGLNPYDKEKGFLADGNFTEAERKGIKPVTHKVLLSEIDKDKKDGGSEVHQYEANTEEAVQNYDQVYYKNVTDKVFLLSVKELKEYVYDRGWEYRAVPTQAAIENYTDKDFVTWIIGSDYWHYWLRTPSFSSTYHLRILYFNENTTEGNANAAGIGIRPALYLDLSSIIFQSGLGSENDPYIAEATIEPNYSNIIWMSCLIIILIGAAWMMNKKTKSQGLCLEANGRV